MTKDQMTTPINLCSILMLKKLMHPSRRRLLQKMEIQQKETKIPLQKEAKFHQKSVNSTGRILKS